MFFCCLKAVVIFIGQGNYQGESQTQSMRQLPQSSSKGFGDLAFVNDDGNQWNYQPILGHLRAKNTLFISLGDYTDRSFERAFDPGFIGLVPTCKSFVH